MSDRSDRHRRWIGGDPFADVCRRAQAPEQPRMAWAQARADEHSVRELYFLELAVRAPDEDSANALELHAYEAYKDALAIKEEHGLER
jgi:hypothetical protein